MKKIAEIVRRNTKQNKMDKINEILNNLDIPYVNSEWIKRDQLIDTDFNDVKISYYRLKENRNLFKIPEKALKEIWRQSQISLLQDLILGLEENKTFSLTKEEFNNMSKDGLVISQKGHEYKHNELNHLKNMLEVLIKNGK